MPRRRSTIHGNLNSSGLANSVVPTPVFIAKLRPPGRSDAGGSNKCGRIGSGAVPAPEAYLSAIF